MTCDICGRPVARDAETPAEKRERMNAIARIGILVRQQEEQVLALTRANAVLMDLCQRLSRQGEEYDDRLDRVEAFIDAIEVEDDNVVHGN